MAKQMQGVMIAAGTVLGIGAGLLDSDSVNAAATVTGEIFIRLLKLASTPIIFLSVLSTLSGMGDLKTAGSLGGQVLRYTLLTTVIAATIALVLFCVVDPARQLLGTVPDPGAAIEPSTDYLQFLFDVIPQNIIAPFLDGQVVGVLFVAILFSVAVLQLPREQGERLHKLFDDLFAMVMAMTNGILLLLPVAAWAFVTSFIKEVNDGTVSTSLALYFTCIVLANLIQAFVVLPLLLWSKGISPLRTFRGMAPALSIAFFAKSSSAALPAAMKGACSQLNVSNRVARFSFPLCTTINMNACAGFILITVLFVSTLNGSTFSAMELIAWVFIATIAAIGNAGVPMGCFLLASSLLATMNVPLTMMGVILPVYALIDMLESAINVWSDACVTCIVDREVASS